ncbi:2'-5' RNA ligase family protein [Candidatus Saccharibacteria bacterium]|nr:2'-5' RNA ligase family protein [Candidatus Saccharibacteria bacterium]
MTRQRYVIIKLLEQLKDGDEFSPDSYPLHITIVPSFQLDSMDDTLLKKIKQLCANFNEFTLTAGEDEFFGPNNEVRVTTMIMNDELRKLHTSLVDVLSDANAIFDEPDYMLEKYRAHATLQESNRLQYGDVATIGSITVIDKLPNGNPGKRKLLKTLHFSKQ